MSIACWLVLPQKGGTCATCHRRIHFVPTNWLVPITRPDDTRSPGYWRHNPRRRA